MTETPNRTPSPNGGANGRGADGKFVVGNRGGPGNPDSRNASKKRAEFWRSIRAKDVRLAVSTIRNVMKSANAKDADRLTAAREILDRVLGKPGPLEIMERIERLEQAVSQRHRSNGNGN